MQSEKMQGELPIVMHNIVTMKMDSCIQDEEIINGSDLQHIMDDLYQDSQGFEMFLQQELPVRTYYADTLNIHIDQEYMESNQICDSTQEVKVENGCLLMPVPARSSPTGSQPCTEEYSGPYDFEVSLEGSTNRRAWVYSPILKKVFIDVDKVLLLQFKVNEHCPIGLRVRALLVYTIPDHINQAVSRCTLHKFNSDPNQLAHAQKEICLCKDYSLVGHVLTTDHVNATYEYNPHSERHSVTVPLDLPQPGADTTTVAYQFGCKTSCPSGMSRRPVNIIFTLETMHGDVVGRRSISVKICSCPKRDKEREEADFDREHNIVSVQEPARRKYHHASDDRQQKRIRIEQQRNSHSHTSIKNDTIERLVHSFNALYDEIHYVHEQQRTMNEKLEHIVNYLKK